MRDACVAENQTGQGSASVWSRGLTLLSNASGSEMSTPALSPLQLPEPLAEQRKRPSTSSVGRGSARSLRSRSRDSGSARPSTSSRVSLDPMGKGKKALESHMTRNMPALTRPMPEWYKQNRLAKRNIQPPSLRASASMSSLPPKRAEVLANYRVDHNNTPARVKTRIRKQQEKERSEMTLNARGQGSLQEGGGNTPVGGTKIFPGAVRQSRLKIARDLAALKANVGGSEAELEASLRALAKAEANGDTIAGAPVVGSDALLKAWEEVKAGKVKLVNSVTIAAEEEEEDAIEEGMIKHAEEENGDVVDDEGEFSGSSEEEEEEEREDGWWLGR